ncbi:Sterile alpha motif domain-containing protein 3 [Holothuria leucospilota]|uniref:Sterile alpha motif domain-containing protein 3 n=1 Tax=Holothuria leucospilota TaxID=206669 RepID=A0A9Q1BAE2_HOLLE|nr:Sterile alpha motif domain-containing protein 3 [Holothuria leucospilota]
MPNFPCSQCVFATQSFLKLLQHYRYLHKGPDSKITCSVEGCHHIFSSARSFQRHIRSKHSEFWNEHGAHRQRNNDLNLWDDDNDGAENGILDNDDGEFIEIARVDPDPERLVVSFLIGLREKYKISNEACSFVAREVGEILNLSSSQLCKRVKNSLQDVNVDPLDLDIDEAFTHCAFEKAFQYYSDARHVNAFCEQNFSFVEPVEYILGRGANGKEKTMQYVSILGTLKALLMQSDVFSEVVNGHSSENEHVFDYCDSALCKENALLSEYQNLQIQLYNDDLHCKSTWKQADEATLVSIFRYLFMFGNSKKKVELEVEGSGASEAQLRDRATKLFSLEDFIMQQWDKAFEEWVDIEEGEDGIETNTKIQIIANASNNSEDQREASSTPDAVGDNSGDGYPKTGQYDRIIDLLLEKYPKLVSQRDMSYASVKTLWKYRLQYKFSNARKREDRSIPVVKARKRKATPSTLSQPTSKHAAPQWGMVNYLPQIPESEDDASIKIHKEWMQQEWGKKKSNYARVADSMTATLSDRRRLVVTEGASLAQVKEQYPWLFDDGELLVEFQRIDGSSSMEQLLTDGVEKYGDAIISCSKALTKKGNLVEKLLTAASLQKEESARKELTKEAAVLAIPGLLHEKVENLMVSGDDADNTELKVFIKTARDDGGKETYDVIVDGLSIASSSTLKLAVANYLAAYYCFNLAYPKCLRKTLQFFQKVVLNIQDNLPIDKTLVKVLDKLNKFQMQ